MSRSCTKNTSNYLSWVAGTLGNLLNGATVISFACRVNFNSLSVASGDGICHIGITGTNTAALYVNVINGVLSVGGRSGTGDSFQSLSEGTVNAATEMYIGGTLNFTADTISCYVAGSATASSPAAVTFANSALTMGTPTGTDHISGFDTGASDDFVDGLVAELALWNIDIGSAGHAAFARRFSPPLVGFRKNLIVYRSLLGPTLSGPYDVGPVPTLNGTVNTAEHPSFIYPSRPRMAMPTSSNVTMDGISLGVATATVSRLSISRFAALEVAITTANGASRMVPLTFGASNITSASGSIIAGDVVITINYTSIDYISGRETSGVATSTIQSSASPAVSVEVTRVASPTIYDFTPKAASAGSEITITGANFIGVNKIKFGRTVAPTFEVVSSTEIRVDVPASAEENEIQIQHPTKGYSKTRVHYVPS